MTDDIREDVRTRVVQWQDPHSGWEQGKTLSGIEYLRAIQRGDLPVPPLGMLMGFRLAEIDEGRVVFTMELGEYLYNPIGAIHGGVAATLLDSAMGCAIQTLAPKGMGYTTLEIKVNYVRAMTLGMGLIRGEGTVIHSGKRTATAEGRIVDANGKLYAHSTTTCIYFPL